ncbi:MAG: hypothetical protein WC082_00140 [Victivallales bacterium]
MENNISMDHTDMKAIDWNSMVASFVVIHVGKGTGMAGLHTVSKFSLNISKKKVFPNLNGIKKVGYLGVESVFLLF